MNHLAHALLAGDDELMRLGGMLGDFVHGPPEALALPERAIEGIRLHRAIDVYTDSHPEVVAARGLFEPPFRRYAGILLDMWFDHCLARDFLRWSGQPLHLFSPALRDTLYRHEKLLPPDLKRFLIYMESHGLPAGYAEPAAIGRSLAGISRRLKRENPLGAALPVLEALREPLQLRFEAFFPHLQGFAREWRGEARKPAT
ncbi:ACP phosphodiesterase [Dyella sp.]|uniref:acyl carrier protein phosphodiesterase n=1 Tax=Dyella sp. TaxID=1869338 RepID=UPI002ED163D4